MNHIPIDKLQEQADLKIDIMRFKMEDAPCVYDEANIQRNDHYVFLICEEGNANVKVDYKNHNLCSGTVYFSIPGQIAHPIYENCMAGWYLAVDSSLISAQYRNIFNSPVGAQIPLNLDKDILRQCLSILNLIKIRTGFAFKKLF